MPSTVIKTFAQKSGKNQTEVEKIWNNAEKEAGKKFTKNDPHYWAYVNGTVQKILGIKESMTFKNFLAITEGGFPSGSNISPLNIVTGDKVQVIKAIKDPELIEGEVYAVADVDDEGDLKLDHPFGPEYTEFYFPKENFKKLI